MHKGLYWNQMITGIGIGLILAALVWISVNQFFPEESEVLVLQTEREIVYYQELGLTGLSFPELSLPVSKISERELAVSELKSNYVLIPDVVTRATEEVPDEVLDGWNNKKNDETLIEQSMLEEFAAVKLEPDLVKEEKKMVNKLDWVQFVVMPGESADNIATRLHKEGLVNGKQFLRYVNRNHLDRRLRFGIFKLRVGMEIEEIVEKLTK